jgi:hypothetical protein
VPEADRAGLADVVDRQLEKAADCLLENKASGVGEAAR